MSRLLVALATFGALPIVTPLAAQVPLRFGVMAGASIANWYGDDVSNTDNRTGFVGGVFVRLPAGMFAIEPQALYVQKGTKADFGGGVTGTVKLDYIEVPVLIKLNIPLADKAIAPNIFVGPAISFKASCKVTGDNGGGGSASADCGDSDSGIKGTDFSGVFGAGLDVNRLSFQIRYDLGLSKLGKGDGAPDIKNKAWLFTAGFAF